MGPKAARSTVRGSHVVRAAALALLATTVLPTAGAWWLNSRRVAVTLARVQAAVASVPTQPDGQLLCGPGRIPDSTATGAGEIHARWVSLVVVDPSGGSPARKVDAWGQCLLAGRGWILSAGANGVIETPLASTTIHGDDIGVRVK